jgi:pyrroline-5-carboxylate reductase
MTTKTIGFVGGGRVVRIILGGLQQAGRLPQRIIVSDANGDVLNTLKQSFPTIEITPENQQAAAQDIVFLALHPPAMGNLLAEVKAALKPSAMVVSLAPKITLTKLTESLGASKIARLIPNAPSIVSAGYNPVAFGSGLTADEKEELLVLFKSLGECPLVDEEKLEAYAIVTAMGPTYLWFQLYHLHELGRSFGLTETEVNDGVSKMVNGLVKTMDLSGLSAQEVMDLVPVKPLGEEEEAIKGIYRAKLTALFAKLKG